MTHEQALRALARLVVICGAKKYGMHVQLGPRTDESEQKLGAGRRAALSLDRLSYPGESGRSDPYRLLRALVFLDRQEKGKP
jgi:hypothetical protein